MLVNNLDEYVKQAMEINYEEKISNYKPDYPTEEYTQLIREYKVPSRAFVKTSARGLPYDEVDVKILLYLIKECHQCTELHRYEASIILIKKIYDKVGNFEDIQKYILGEYKTNDQTATNHEWADTYCPVGSGNIFYVLQINIGANKLVKVGITSDRLRTRLSALRNDIKQKYPNHHVKITPILLIQCEENEKIEQEVLLLISELNVPTTKYDFRGCTETFNESCLKKILKQAIVPSLCKFSHNVLYDSSLPPPIPETNETSIDQIEESII